MSAGIAFYEKSKIDLDEGTAVTVTVTDAVATDNGQLMTDLMRNRNNVSGWATTGSTDAAGTYIVFDMVDEREIDTIFIIGHNLKKYTIQYWDGAAYQDFSTAISTTTNVASVTVHSFDNVSTSKIKLVITGTFVADDDKFIKQFVITEKMGQFFEGYQISKSEVGQERRVIKMLSGKTKIIRNVGSFSCVISRKNSVSDGDLRLIERIYTSYGGVLVWLCGGDDTQFRTKRKGFRLEDLFLMDAKNDYVPEWDGGFYEHGTNVKVELLEVV